MVCFWTYFVFAFVWYIGLVSIMGNSHDEAYAKVTSPLKKLFQNIQKISLKYGVKEIL